MFSPYYAWSGRRDPLNHVAVNVALYGPSGRWAMTERGRKRAAQHANGFTVGPSSIVADATGITVTIDERCAPIPRKLKGTVRLELPTVCDRAFVIDAAGDHVWRPVAPAAPITVTMAAPALSWRGTGYLDSNWGRVPLEHTFQKWDWMRADLGGGASAVFYDTLETSGHSIKLGLLSHPDGRIEDIALPHKHALPTSLWRVPRGAWSDGAAPALRRTLEAAPFYARSEVTTTLDGRPCTAIQESLHLKRFKNPVVKAMLPFRMPRLP